MDVVLTGLVLLVVVLSGAALVLDPELQRALHPELHRGTPSGRPITYETALAAVRAEYPRLDSAASIRKGDLYVVPGRNYLVFAHVDAGTGRVLGRYEPNGGVIGFLRNSTCAR